jgi:hypothetical protein
LATSQTPTALRAAPRSRAEPADYDDAALERLADLLVERLATRLGGLIPEQVESLVDAVEIARLFGRTRSWVYEHAGELGAVRLGSGPRPRLGFSPARVAAHFEQASEPRALTMPQPTKPRRARRRRTDRTASGAKLLRVKATTAPERRSPDPIRRAPTA